MREARTTRRLTMSFDLDHATTGVAAFTIMALVRDRAASFGVVEDVRVTVDEFLRQWAPVDVVPRVVVDLVVDLARVTGYLEVQPARPPGPDDDGLRLLHEDDVERHGDACRLPIDIDLV